MASGAGQNEKVVTRQRQSTITKDVVGQSPARRPGPRTPNTPLAPGPVLTVDRVYPESVNLPDGRIVFIAGGDSSFGGLTTVDIYDPATDTVTSASPMMTARNNCRALLLPNGKVLAAGGFNAGTGPQMAELYDPATGNWQSGGLMTVERAGHTMTLLANGRVLVTGGTDFTSGSNVATAELYDPATGTWTSTGSMNHSRDRHAATLLPNGKVLVTGGWDENGFGAISRNTAELYDPATGTWTYTTPMPTNLAVHTSTLLMNGKVFIAGGTDQTYNQYHSGLIYDPATATWTATSSQMATPRDNHTATLTTDGKVMLFGGLGGPGFLDSVEIYDPATDAWSTGPLMSEPRAYHTSILSTDGRIVVAGGLNNGVSLSSIDFYNGGSTFLSGSGSTQSASGKIAPGGIVTVSVTINNALPGIVVTSFEATIPNTLNLVQGSCTAGSGTCQTTSVGSPNSAGEIYRSAGLNSSQSGGTVSWTGPVPGSGSVTIQFQVQVGPQASNGTQYCVTTTIGGASSAPTCFTVNAVLAGPGLSPLLAGPASQQKPGSILIYNLYTSGINPTTNDTRITLTNTNPVERANVHLFFVDGLNCAVADQFVTLTQNQTMSIQASDIDPGVTGYIIAVATDESGCPIVRNDLIGESFVRFESGHMANLPALSVSAVGVPNCSPNSATTTLAFDGVTYNPLPRTLALDSLESRATGNSTMIVVNRMGGDLTTGASALGSLAGLLFDDREASQSFTLPGVTCQMRGILGNNFPRTAPRYDAVIPAGRTGWMKLWPVEDAGITGAMINEATVGFSQGHNLHALTTTSSVVFTIPVFPAR